MRLVIKAKYTRRWRGADGKWQYEYPREKTGRKRMTVNVQPESGAGYSSVKPSKFVGVREAKVPKEFAAFVTKYTAEQYKKKGAKTYVSSSGKSGYAIASDGDLISVFSAPGAHEGKAMVQNAIRNGAKKLDCLGKTLVDFYKKFGFEVTETLQWDDQYAPSNWDYDKHGRPSVYMMELAGAAQAQKSKDDSEETPEFIALSKRYVSECLE
jgi:hypothetical protein